MTITITPISGAIEVGDIITYGKSIDKRKYRIIEVYNNECEIKAIKPSRGFAKHIRRMKAIDKLSKISYC